MNKSTFLKYTISSLLSMSLGAMAWASESQKDWDACNHNLSISAHLGHRTSAPSGLRSYSTDHDFFLLGDGGSGSVYRVENKSSGRSFIAKELRKKNLPAQMTAVGNDPFNMGLWNELPLNNEDLLSSKSDQVSFFKMWSQLHSLSSWQLFKVVRIIDSPSPENFIFLEDVRGKEFFSHASSLDDDGLAKKLLVDTYFKIIEEVRSSPFVNELELVENYHFWLNGQKLPSYKVVIDLEAISDFEIEHHADLDIDPANLSVLQLKPDNFVIDTNGEWVLIDPH